MEKLKIDCQCYLIGNYEIGISDENEKIQLLVDVNNYFWYENSFDRDYELVLLLETLMNRSQDWNGTTFSKHIAALNCEYFPTRQKCKIML
jgi:hypothetical protein